MNHLTVLYGSQTGNTEDLARRFGYMCRSCGLDNIIIKQMDDFAIKDLINEKFIVFLCSTTGHGQEPENMHKLFNFMRRRDLPSQCLKDLHCAVFGVGDSSYAKFNWVAKILHRRLVNCGAQTLIDLVLGDEKHPFGCDAEIYPAFDRLLQELRKYFPAIQISDGSFCEQYKLPGCSYDLRTGSTSSILKSQDPFSQAIIDKHGIRSAICIGNERLTPESHFQDTRLIKLKPVDNQGLDFKPGDVCAIHPANSDENVNDFISFFNLDPLQKICLEKRFPNFMVNYLYDYLDETPSNRRENDSTGVTLYDVVKFYLDINSVPRRSFFELLSGISQDSLEAGKLKEFATTVGQEELYEYCWQPKRNILEVLHDFPKTLSSVTLSHIFDLVPPIKPRSFSIASSARMFPDQLHLLVAVVKYKTRLVKPRLGLCSNYLAHLNPDNGNERVYFSTKRTSFKIINPERPLVMFGPGTGVAPFRSFLQEKKMINSGNNHLFFGCRYKGCDFYFQHEWDSLVADNTLNYYVAFSREQPKQYIQDIMLELRDQLYDLIINQGGYIYVAGNSKLPEAMRDVLKLVLTSDTKDESGDEQEDHMEQPRPPVDLVDELESIGRIQYDCW